MAHITGYGWYMKIEDRLIQFATDEQAREFEQEEDEDDSNR